MNMFELDSCGIPLGINEVKTDPQTGEIMVKGRSVFMGYLN
jgi:long-subunit acyl-CoA synthetase (AMP-forming)